MKSPSWVLRLGHLWAFTSAHLKICVYFSIRTYFTYLLFKILHIKLSILHYISLKCQFFYCLFFYTCNNHHLPSSSSLVYVNNFFFLKKLKCKSYTIIVATMWVNFELNWLKYNIFSIIQAHLDPSHISMTWIPQYPYCSL